MSVPPCLQMDCSPTIGDRWSIIQARPGRAVSATKEAIPSPDVRPLRSSPGAWPRRAPPAVLEGSPRSPPSSARPRALSCAVVPLAGCPRPPYRSAPDPIESVARAATSGDAIAGRAGRPSRRRRTSPRSPRAGSRARVPSIDGPSPTQQGCEDLAGLRHVPRWLPLPRAGTDLLGITDRTRYVSRDVRTCEHVWMNEDVATSAGPASMTASRPRRPKRPSAFATSRWPSRLAILFLLLAVAPPPPPPRRWLRAVPADEPGSDSLRPPPSESDLP